MENSKTNNKDQYSDNQTNRINKPNENTVPKFNSTTEKRAGKNLPYIENLDHNIDDSLSENLDMGPERGYNDESLYGKGTVRDQGASSEDDDKNHGKDEDEKLIRT